MVFHGVFLFHIEYQPKMKDNEIWKGMDQNEMEASGGDRNRMKRNG